MGQENLVRFEFFLKNDLVYYVSDLWLETMGRKTTKFDFSRNFDFLLGPLWNVVAHISSLCYPHNSLVVVSLLSISYNGISHDTT